VTRDLTHSLDALAACPTSQPHAAFGPQHGLRGDKQDNMMESPDFTDPLLGIPGVQPVRRGAPADRGDDGHFDVLLVDLQDLGCRIYTFITTLRYVLEELRSTARRCGCSTAPTPPAGRSRADACCRAGRASSAPGRCRCATA
jgi:uncharacterized protein YbbC (DUF1343 family)